MTLQEAAAKRHKCPDRREQCQEAVTSWELQQPEGFFNLEPADLNCPPSVVSPLIEDGGAAPPDWAEVEPLSSASHGDNVETFVLAESQPD